MLTKACKEIMAGTHTINSARNAYRVSDITIEKHAAKIGVTLLKTKPIPPIPKPKKDKESELPLAGDRTVERIRAEISNYQPAVMNHALRLIWQGKWDEARIEVKDIDQLADKYAERFKTLKKCRNMGEVNEFLAKHQGDWK